MGEAGDKPIRRNNSYTSYTMTIIGMHNEFRLRESEFKASAAASGGEEGDKAGAGQTGAQVLTFSLLKTFFFGLSPHY